jgi:hypothetical protein
MRADTICASDFDLASKWYPDKALGRNIMNSAEPGGWTTRLQTKGDIN